jgi:hypothetical protein
MTDMGGEWFFTGLVIAAVLAIAIAVITAALRKS